MVHFLEGERRKNKWKFEWLNIFNGCIWKFVRLLDVRVLSVKCWVLNAQMEPIASSSLISPLWTGRMQCKRILSLKSLAQRQQLRVQTLTSSWVCVWLLWRFSVIIACSIFLHSIYEFNLSRLFTLVDYFLLVTSRSFFFGLLLQSFTAIAQC